MPVCLVCTVRIRDSPGWENKLTPSSAWSQEAADPRGYFSYEGPQHPATIAVLPYGTC